MNAFRSAVAGPILALVLTAAPAAAREQALEAMLEPIRRELGLPALAAAVTQGGRIIAIGATGTRVLGRDLPVTRDDRFHIGSDTKAMTATLAAMMVEAGKLRWDSTIGEVLGDIPDLNPKFAAITLTQLLTHSSGIPSDNADIFKLYFNAETYDYNPDDYRRRIIGILGKREPAIPEGSPFQYSNFGYVVVGAMVEKAAGKPWDALIIERLFVPLGLKTAGLGPQATYGRIDAPVGHAIGDDGKVTPRFWGAGADAPAPIGPAGIAHLSIRDFARWGAWNAGEGKRGPALVKPETLKALHRARVRTPVIENPKPGTPKTGEYAMGWGILAPDWAGKPILTHTGSNSMNLAAILLDPPQDLSIVVATNFPGEKADLAINRVLQALYQRYGKTR